MANIVIDASAVLCVLLGEPLTQKVLDFTKGSQLHAPAVIEYEIGNALSSLIKRGSLAYSDALLVFHEFCKIPLRQVVPDIPDALRLCGEYRIYAYDAYYLDCARQTGFPLLTLDAQLLHTARLCGLKWLEV